MVKKAAKNRENSTSKAEPIVFSLVEINFVYSKTWRSENFKPFVVPNVVPMFRMGDPTGKVHFDSVTLTSADGREEQVYVCRFPTEFRFIYVRASGTDREVVAPPNEDEIEAEISATVEVCYRTNGPNCPETEVLEHWANRNVVLHAWPYWREFCQSAMGRMNIPSVVMPLVRFDDLEAKSIE